MIILCGFITKIDPFHITHRHLIYLYNILIRAALRKCFQICKKSPVSCGFDVFQKYLFNSGPKSNCEDLSVIHCRLRLNFPCKAAKGVILYRCVFSAVYTFEQERNNETESPNQLEMFSQFISGFRCSITAT